MLWDAWANPVLICSQNERSWFPLVLTTNFCFWAISVSTCPILRKDSSVHRSDFKKQNQANNRCDQKSVRAILSKEAELCGKEWVYTSEVVSGLTTEFYLQNSVSIPQLRWLLQQLVFLLLGWLFFFFFWLLSPFWGYSRADVNKLGSELRFPPPTHFFFALLVLRQVRFLRRSDISGENRTAALRWV